MEHPAIRRNPVQRPLTADRGLGGPTTTCEGAYSCETKDFLVVLTDYDVDPIDRSG